jgi:hypothetical protein
MCHLNIWLTPIVNGEPSAKALFAWSAEMMASPRDGGGSVITVKGAANASGLEVAETPAEINQRCESAGEMQDRKWWRRDLAARALAGLLANPAYRPEHDHQMRYREAAADARTYADLLIADLSNETIGNAACV